MSKINKLTKAQKKNYLVTLLGMTPGTFTQSTYHYLIFEPSDGHGSNCPMFIDSTKTIDQVKKKYL